VGLLWNPAKATARAMKPFLGYTAKPAKSEVSLLWTGGRVNGVDVWADLQASLVDIDKKSVLAEIARMGKGLIHKIQVK